MPDFGEYAEPTPAPVGAADYSFTSKGEDAYSVEIQEGLTPQQLASDDKYAVEDGYVNKDDIDYGKHWQTYVNDYVGDLLDNTVKTFGLDEDLWDGWFRAKKPQMIRYVYDEWFAPAMEYGLPLDDIYSLPTLGKAAWNWLQMQDGSNALRHSTTAISSGQFLNKGGGGGGRGGGSRGPSMSDFDLDALTEAVQNAWRGTLLAENPKARQLAKDYANAVINNPDQKLDFNQFVLNAMRQTSRHKSIYKAKPEHLNEQQFLAPYLSTAQQYLKPENADRVAIQGAQLSADPNAYRGLIQNQREAYSSSAFINSMGERLSNLKGIFRG